MNINTECFTDCGLIRESIKSVDNEAKLVYKRSNVTGYFKTFEVPCETGKIIVSEIIMDDESRREILICQHNKEYIKINRQPGEKSDTTDADIANIILEIAKEVKSPIMYANSGVPTLLFENTFLWKLHAEEIELDWILRH